MDDGAPSICVVCSDETKRASDASADSLSANHVGAAIALRTGNRNWLRVLSRAILPVQEGVSLVNDSLIPAYTNPFNPGFGVDPPYFAGRQALFHRTLANVIDGPNRGRYVQIIAAGRGLGKTTLLNRLEKHGHAEMSWPTFRWTASPKDDLEAKFNDAYDDLVNPLTSRIRAGKVKLRAGFVEAELTRPDTRRPSTFNGQMRRLGKLLAATNQTMLFLVDELQAGNHDSVIELSNTIQETNGAGLPIALIAVGLPTTRSALKSIKGATYIERQTIDIMGDLAPNEALAALEHPINDHGRAHDPEIFDIMLNVAGGYPYALQLVGQRTWDAADHHERITPEHAELGAASTRDELDTLYSDRWTQLTDGQRKYFLAVIDTLKVDGTTTSTEVAHVLGRTTTDVSKFRGALVHEHHLLYSAKEPELKVALPGFETWVRHHTGRERPSAPPPEVAPTTTNPTIDPKITAIIEDWGKIDPTTPGIEPDGMTIE
jgi:hypothetical protein